MNKILHHISEGIFAHYKTTILSYMSLFLIIAWGQRHILLPAWTIYIPMLMLGTWCGWRIHRETSLKPRIKFFLNEEVYWKVEVNKDNTFNVQFEPYCQIHKLKFYKIDDNYFCNSPYDMCKYGTEKYSIEIMHERAKSFAEHIILNNPEKLLNKI